jgi:hypothetical protein
MDISAVHRGWYTPVVGAVLKGRAESLAISAAAALQVGMVYAHLPGWSCPIKAALGIPCPGCGLTAAMDELLHGHVLASLHTHVFASIFLAAFFIILVSILLPEKQRQKMIIGVAHLESRTGLTALVLTGLMLYWVIRLIGLA